MSIHISSQFDSGNIEVIEQGDPQNIRLRIRPDTQSDFFQWFHFRVAGARNIPLRLTIENAGDCSYADGWKDYRCAVSYDRREWFRIEQTHYDGQHLTIDITPQHDSVWLAYFEPYSHERHQDLIARCGASPFAEIERLGSTVLGRDLDVVRVGQPGGSKKNVWIIARQHPGEAMAEWFVEGLLDRLLDPHDATSREIREGACLHVVPSVNPDGAFAGNLRANAAGANLNREWLTPSPDRSPEVMAVEQGMRRSGVDLFLDIHGDETLPYVFIDGSQMVPNYGDRNTRLQKQFLENLKRASPDFQTDHGYAENRFSEELLTLASKWVAHTFGCVAVTLEMPFKDNVNAPNPQVGWNGARSKQLGAAMLTPILLHVKSLDMPMP